MKQLRLALPYADGEYQMRKVTPKTRARATSRSLPGLRLLPAP